MKLKTGIIGCGKVGDFHAKAYAQLENSEFTAVCDADLERAKAFAERYNVHAYSDIAEMIQKAEEELRLMADYWREGQPCTYKRKRMALEAYKMYQAAHD